MVEITDDDSEVKTVLHAKKYSKIYLFSHYMHRNFF